MNSTRGEPEADPPARAPIIEPDPTPFGERVEPAAPKIVDPAVFTSFYKKSVPRLVAFLIWQGAAPADAAECAQEALARAYQHWVTLDLPYAWCRTVASRLYVRRIASLREKSHDDLENAGSPLLIPATDPATVSAELEQRHEVLRLLRRLPPRQRQVLAWTYDGASPTEIAAALKISPEAVRASLKKARAALRAHLCGDGGENQ